MSLAGGRQAFSVLSSVKRRVREDMQFSNIFTVDLVASIGYLLATLLLAPGAELAPARVAAISALPLAYASLHIAKILFVVYLEKSGGDAKQFVGSDRLVTSGVYAYSRNPVYLVSIIQSFLWSILLIALAAGQPIAWIGYALAPALLYGHFWGIDRLIIPNEEAALMRVHPEKFAAYAARVRRWWGRSA